MGGPRLRRRANVKRRACVRGRAREDQGGPGRAREAGRPGRAREGQGGPGRASNHKLELHQTKYQKHHTT